MRQRTVPWLLLLAACVLWALPAVSQASGIRLLDDRIVIHGKVSEQWLCRTEGLQPWERTNLRGYNWYHARTTLKLETMFRAYDDGENEFNLYGVWKNFYDAATSIDGGYRSNIKQMSGSKGIRQLKSYNNFRDICRELYAEWNNDLFQLRLGKQIISWGETSVERMTDIVNPVDLRGMLNPAYPDFAEIKRGLYMARLLLTPQDVPMDMHFEFVVVPNFEPNYVWPSGYHLNHGKSAQGLRSPNEVTLGWYRDTPSDSWTKPEFGFRIRGFLGGWEWTLLYFHHRADQPVPKDGKLLESQLSPVLGRRMENIYRYGWQDSFGFTFNKTVAAKIPLIPFTTCAMTGNVLRGEFLLEKNKDHIRLGGAPAPRIGRVSEHNRYAFALGWDGKIFVPGLTPWARNKLLGSSTQLFMEWVPSRHRSDIIYPWYAPPVPDFRRKGHHWAQVTQSFNYELWHGRILPGFYVAHALTEGSGYYAPAIGFKPTFSWTFLVRYLNYYGYPGNYVNHLDNLTFEITYEF